MSGHTNWKISARNHLGAMALSAGVSSALFVLGASVLRASGNRSYENMSYENYAEIGAITGASTFGLMRLLSMSYGLEQSANALSTKLGVSEGRESELLRFRLFNLMVYLMTVTTGLVPTILATLAINNANAIPQGLGAGFVGVVAIPTASTLCCFLSCFALVQTIKKICGPFGYRGDSDDDYWMASGSWPPAIAETDSGNSTVIAPAITETRINVDNTSPVDTKKEQSQPLLDKKESSALTL